MRRRPNERSRCSDEQIALAVANSSSVRRTLLQLGLSDRGANTSSSCAWSRACPWIPSTGLRRRSGEPEAAVPQLPIADADVRRAQPGSAQARVDKRSRTRYNSGGLSSGSFVYAEAEAGGMPALPAKTYGLLT
jgi:hypothetical protein